MFAHFARQMGQYFVLIIQPNPKHGSGEDCGDSTFYFYWFFVSH
jgi:hypothetical protein